MKTGQEVYASGKIILSGEHAVVYGARAIVTSIPNAVKASITQETDQMQLSIPEWGIELYFDPETPQETLYGQTMSLIVKALDVDKTPFQIVVEPNIPFAMGLGGSAAVAVAVIRAIDKAFERGMMEEDINKLAYECEKITHGTPSGVDNYVATYGDMICFRKDVIGGKTIVPVNKPMSLPMLVVLTGKRGYTARTVERIAMARERNTDLYDQIFNKIDRISGKIQLAIEGQDIESLGRLMNENQTLLRQMRVSCSEIDDVVETALSSGALGAKLTGGGDGGAVIVLCPDNQNSVRSTLLEKGYDVKEMML